MNGTGKKKLPIGLDDFEKLRQNDFYYVDKTGMIRDLLENWGEVNLFTRPRRFGKSLNMSMLKYFFEINTDREIFEGLAIMEETELCGQYMGKFPVIFLSLKDVNGLTFENARAVLCMDVGMEALRVSFLKESGRLNEEEKEMYRKLIQIGGEGEGNFVMEDSVLEGSLSVLTHLLHKHYGQKAVLLIDEYDVPLAKAFDNGYYDQMVNLMRNFLGQALKTNPSLQFAVLTGCMRIAKESIFTGLNNLVVFSVADVRFDEYFGFTDNEVRKFLEYYGFSNRYGAVKDWYDGYQFGNLGVYCPWDVINYGALLRADSRAQPRNYWINTSSNDIVRHFIEKADTGRMKKEIETLVAGETVTKEIHQELTYREMYSTVENIWSVLFATGYLTQRGLPEGKKFRLAIPNMEVREIYTEQIMELFKEGIKKNGEALEGFCTALKNGDAEEVEKCFHAYLKKTISIRDTFVRKHLKENFYHGILLGLLEFQADWIVSSNKESGSGYGDILIEIEEEELGIVIEVKYAQDRNLEKSCKEALEQIEKNHYENALYEEGVQKVIRYGIACYKNLCRVQMGEKAK